MITLNNISVSFDNKTVIENFSFKFEKGKKYAIMGESGCGKTTILNVISGLLKPQIGELIKDPSCKISYVFQDPRLFDWLTVLENVAIATGIDKNDGENKAKMLLKTLGLEDSIYQYPPELSGGMKQRVSIARALAYDPSVILLDEPLGALDSQTKTQVANFIFDFCNDKTVIMVTHNESDLQYVDEILLVDATRITHLAVAKK